VLQKMTDGSVHLMGMCAGHISLSFCLKTQILSII